MHAVLKMFFSFFAYILLILFGLFGFSVGYIEDVQVQAITENGDIVDTHYHYNGEPSRNRYRRSFNGRPGKTHYINHIHDQTYTEDEDTQKQCKEQLDLVNEAHRDQIPHRAHLVYIGDTLIMQCHYCTDHKKVMRSARVWFKARHGVTKIDRPNEVSEVQLDMHDDEQMNRVYTTIDHTLVIKDVRLTDAGTYFCEDYEVYTHRIHRVGGIKNYEEVLKTFRTDRNVLFLYHIGVALKEKDQFIFVSNENGSFLEAPKEDYINDQDHYTLRTEWDPWGPCSICGPEFGEKKRRGECLISRTLDAPEVQPKQLADILLIYPAGAPCHSSMFYEFQKITSFPSQIQIDKCLIDCMGKGQNAKGQKYTTFQDFGDIKVDETGSKKRIKATKHDLFEKEGETIRLACPGATIDTAVSWRNGSSLLRETEVEGKSQGRVRYDMSDALVIHNLTTYDAVEYSCFYNMREVAKYKITVHLKPRVPYDEVKKGLAYLGMSYAFSFLIFLGCLGVKHRQRLVQVKKKPQAEELQRQAGSMPRYQAARAKTR